MRGGPALIRGRCGAATWWCLRQYKNREPSTWNFAGFDSALSFSNRSITSARLLHSPLVPGLSEVSAHCRLRPSRHFQACHTWTASSLRASGKAGQPSARPVFSIFSGVFLFCSLTVRVHISPSTSSWLATLEKPCAWAIFSRAHWTQRP